ncbi:CP family cyanate transporter-like MFS transporter [Saccharothrix tamanrassetensis]|uniref:CP family cyanate transporter-like MFS transporter n=1 Tax=Saccharothrix tamanrassetensis TaxID=1051531 RepID=A0A841CSJ5_9PSEU|nr:MFS transporter [Saccharothrix tamanrassetensis]MBB5959833.1 CP family cyanate transporter-like MFS transporter [Saccharothrix tamanrassetensis]
MRLPRRPPARGLAVLAGVVLIAANLRVAVTSLGAVLDQVRDDLGMSTVTVSTAATLPVLCFGVVAAATPWVVRRVGAPAGLGIAIAALLVGLLVRVSGGEGTLLVGTFLACAGIATANVLVPVVVKAEFPHRVGEVTGAYSAVLSLGAAVGAVATVPVGTITGGWRGGLAAWSVLAAAALLAWLPLARRRTAPAEAAMSVRVLMRSPVAWVVTLLFATQSLLAFAVMAWLPTVYHDAGFSFSEAGALLSVSVLAGVPVYFVVPVLASRLRTQGCLGAGLTACQLVGLTGLLASPATVPWLWALLIGVGGGVFPLTLALFSLRTRSTAGTAALSALAQSGGYLVAAGGPFLVGVLRDATGSWSVPILFMIVICLLQVGLSFAAGKRRFTTTAEPP